MDVVAKGNNAAFWRNKRVVVTGGGGFLGSHVVEQLRERQCEEIIIPRSRDYDLRESLRRQPKSEGGLNFASWSRISSLACS